MPSAPPRPCTQPGCPTLVPGGGRCEQHHVKRPSAARRGYDQRWQRFAHRYLRAHPWCVHPGCHQPATVVDHIDGLGPHGPQGFDEANCRALCAPHHNQRTARDQPGGWNRPD